MAKKKLFIKKGNMYRLRYVHNHAVMSMDAYERLRAEWCVYNENNTYRWFQNEVVQQIFRPFAYSEMTHNEIIGKK